MKKIYFLLSIDTEEEWDWEGPFPQKRVCVDNIKHIPAFQTFLNGQGIKPSYFMDYAVMENAVSRAILQSVVAENPHVEVCAHLHPWVNPPVVPVETEAMSHIVNLPIETVKLQLQNLTQLLTECFGRRPTSFRSGRWGINGEILHALIEQGYKTDSSIYPYYHTAHFSCRDNNAIPYWPDLALAETPGDQRQILEVPVTAGFNRKNFLKLNAWHQRLEQRPWHYLRAVGLLWQTTLLRKLYLSPELTQTPDLIALCKHALLEGHQMFHMYLHSSSLMPGAGSYVKTEQDKAALLKRIDAVLNFLKSQSELICLTVAEFSELYRQGY